jgi:hypothetical protein
MGKGDEMSKGIKIIFNLASKEEKISYGQVEDYLYFSGEDEAEEAGTETKTLDEVLAGLIERVATACKEQNLVVDNREEIYEELVKDIIASLRQEVERIELEVLVAKFDEKESGKDDNQ